MARDGWIAAAGRGVVVWVVFAAASLAGPPPDFFQNPHPKPLPPPPPPRGKHVASYGKAYDRAYAKRRGNEVVGARREAIAEYQAIEDERARAEGRRPRDIEKEVRGGLFAMSPAPESFAEALESSDRAFVHDCMGGDHHRRGAIAERIETWLAGWRKAGRTGPVPAVAVDRAIRFELKSTVVPEEERSSAERLDDARRLSPVELDLCIRAYRKRADLDGSPPFPFLAPDRFAEAMTARNGWFAPVPTPADPAAAARARRLFSAQLDLCAVEGEERRDLVREFERQVVHLPPWEEARRLATRSSPERLLARAQREENRVSQERGRAAEDLTRALDEGRVFRPDLRPELVVQSEEPRSGISFADDRWSIRPDEEEQREELAALWTVGRWLGLDAGVVEEIVALRRMAWNAIPQRLPEVDRALVERQPTAGELEIIVARARRDVLERLGRRQTPQGGPDDPDPLHAAKHLTDACRAYYSGRDFDPRQSRRDVRAAARLNYRAMLEAERIDADEIERRLAEWDAEAP